MLVGMDRRWAAATAFAASFSVYAIPLVGPHAVWLTGEMLFRGGAERQAGWAAANVAVAAGAQIAIGALTYWLVRRPGWRRGALVSAVFLLTLIAFQRVFLVTIPTRFLEEPDSAAENASWPEVCSVPGVWLTPLHTGQEVWLRYNQEPNQYAVLTMPGCRIARVALPASTVAPGGRVDFTLDVTSVVPGGRGVVQRWETAAGKATWWLIPGMSALPAPENRTGASASYPPVLSGDGAWAAWLDQHRIVLRRVDDSQVERTVDLTGLGLGSVVLRGVDMKLGELRLWRNDHAVTVGLDGVVKREFPAPPVRAQSTTYVECGAGWLAWDAYREDGAYRLEWSLAGGSGRHQVPLGRTIHGAACDADGRWIAVSVGTSLNIGTARDAVYVRRAGDGSEVFRRYLPRYSRSPVAFLAGGYLLYSDLAGVHAAHPNY